MPRMELSENYVISIVTHQQQHQLYSKTLGVDFTNVFARIFCARFSYEHLFSSYVLVTYKKRARKTCAKTLVKSTQDGHSLSLVRK